MLLDTVLGSFLLLLFLMGGGMKVFYLKAVDMGLLNILLGQFDLLSDGWCRVADGTRTFLDLEHVHGSSVSARARQFVKMASCINFSYIS